MPLHISTMVANPILVVNVFMLWSAHVFAINLFLWLEKMCVLNIPFKVNLHICFCMGLSPFIQICQMCSYTCLCMFVACFQMRVCTFFRCTYTYSLMMFVASASPRPLGLCLVSNFLQSCSSDSSPCKCNPWGHSFVTTRHRSCPRAFQGLLKGCSGPAQEMLRRSSKSRSVIKFAAQGFPQWTKSIQKMSYHRMSFDFCIVAENQTASSKYHCSCGLMDKAPPS